jgi:hypothetical protein
MDTERAITIINTLGLLLLGFLEWNNRRRQTASQSDVGEAEAAEKITHSATTLVQQLQTELTLLRPLPIRIAQLEAEVESLRRSNDRLVKWTERLVNQIETSGLTPVPFRLEPESDRMKTLPTEKARA